MITEKELDEIARFSEQGESPMWCAGKVPALVAEVRRLRGALEQCFAVTNDPEIGDRETTQRVFDITRTILEKKIRTRGPDEP